MKVSLLPTEIQNLILSFTLSPQPKFLLNDIESLVSTKYLLDEIYENDNDTFLNDLYIFLGLEFIDLFYKFDNLIDVVKYALYDFVKKPVKIQINILLSMMSPDQRNNYITHFFT